MIDFDHIVLGPLEDIFGQPVTYSPQAGGSFPLSGIFDRSYMETVVSPDGAVVANRMPVLGVRAAAFPPGVEPRQGDTLIVCGLKYAVTQPEPDGHGHILLKLKASK